MNPFLSESQRYLYDLTPASVVIDAGCYHGDFAIEIDRLHHCSVYALEPVPEFYEICVKRFADHPNLKVYSYALFDQNSAVRMGISDNSSGIRSSGAQSIICRGVTLKHFMDGRGLERCHLLKLNIETAEFPVLYNLIVDGMLPRIDNLQIQWHGIESFHNHYNAIRDELLKTHDHVWGEDPLLWQSYRIKK